MTIEMKERKDPVSGVNIRQLTSYFAHSWHIYFTYSGWYDNDRKLIFNSHRGNQPGMYSMDLESYEITQVMKGSADGYFNSARLEIYGCRQKQIFATSIVTGEQRIVYDIPSGFSPGGIASTCDGNVLCVALHEDVNIDKSGLGKGYVGFKEFFEARPLSRVFQINLDSLAVEQLHETRAWIGHINPSPTRPELITFCHEGPWQRVEQRIWGVNLKTNEVWPIRPQQNETDAVGHEFWLADGEHVGYQGWMPECPVFGIAKYDNSTISDWQFPVSSEHFYCNDKNLVVGDGLRSPYMLMWQLNGDSYSEPRVLCKHRCSRHHQATHVHPRISPDGKYVLYTSDDSGYANIYQVFIPPFESLPTLEAVAANN